ncbi:TPA: hypothetical protein ACU1RY_000510 [Staphylococcus aureus]
MTNNYAVELLEGFLNPKALEENDKQLKRLRILNTKELINIFCKIRDVEIQNLKANTNIYTQEIENIKNGIKGSELEQLISYKDMENAVEYLIKDCYIWLYIFFLKKDKNFFEDHIYIKNKEAVDKAIQEFSGCIIGQLHFGPFQLTAPVLVNLRYQLLQIFGDNDAEKWAHKLMRKYDNPKGYYDSTCVNKNLFVREALKALKNKKIVLLPIEVNGTDQIPTQTTQFLGKEIYAPNGAIRMSYLSKTPLIITYSYIKNNKLYIEFSNPITVEEKSQIDSKNKEIFKIIENKVKEKPMEWRGWGFLNEMLKSEGDI